MKDGTLGVTPRGEREVVMTRTFRAPRVLVFKAMTEPALVQRWLLGPPGWAMVRCQIDFRVGGAFRYDWKHPDGRTLWLSGVFQEIVPPAKIVHLELMEGYPEQSLVTGTLMEEGGQTTLTMTVLFPSKQVRDGALKSGMASGVAASYDRLETLLVAM